MQLDKRLVLRMFLLIIQALEYHMSITKYTSDEHTAWFMVKRDTKLAAAKHTFVRLITQAGYTLEKLEKD